MGQDRRLATVRKHRSSSNVAIWVRVVGVLAALLVVSAFGLGPFGFYRSGVKTCLRCGAVESGPEVLGVWLGTERPRSPGRELVERVAGACGTHRFASTGCWRSFSGVACSWISTGERVYEICALAGDPTAERLAARLAEHSAEERETILFDAHPVDEPRLDTVEAARRWVARVLEKQGWQDLAFAPSTPPR